MFVHLHVHSYYSFCRGVSSIEQLCETVKKSGMNRMALTDTNGIYGLIWFLQIAKETGITPIIGAEIKAENLSVVLLVQNSKGYANLCQILSQRHLQDNFSMLRSISSHADGLFILCGSIPLLNLLRPAIKPGQLFVEIQPGPQRKSLIEYSKMTNISPVATNRVHFIKKDDYNTHRLLRAIDCNTSLSRLPEDELESSESWLKTPGDMAAAFMDYPEALENTEYIADHCMTDLDFGGFIFPDIKTPNNLTVFEYLKELCYIGAKRRYGAITKQVRDRLEYELEIISTKGFAPYFLVAYDIVLQSLRTCGRGSAAASIVSYCLGITHVDPIKHDLFFERFLNLGRKDPPDIDVDFPWDERDDILNYVFTKYDPDKTGMIANHVTFKARAAVREIAKVYGLPESEINTVTKKLSGYWSSEKVSKIVNTHPVYRYQEFHDPWPEILQLAEKLDGIPRHLSVHCGGVVITPKAINTYVPCQKMPKNVNAIQWEKDQAEEAGLIKMDLLGNRSLAVIRDALKALKRNYNIDINYEKWNPLTDKKTQQLIKKGDTIGVFYVESPAMRLLQKKARTGDFEHLVIHSSMIRPAANVYIQEYLKRLHGEPYKPLHPLLDEILKETYGIMCYQEDVSKVAIALAGFEPAEADQLRKILSKKRIARKMEDFRDKFFLGAQKNGVDEITIDKIWQMIMSFTGYSFCKPHSASFAMVSFKSCYLRAHYPAEFMAAVISNQGGYYSTFAYISEARRMGLVVKLPEINDSEWEYTGSDRQIRVGFMQLKGISRNVIDKLLKVRRENRPYLNFNDFLTRVEPDFSDAKILIKAGVFDELEHNKTRPELMWQLSAWINKTAYKPKNSISLFDEDSTPVPNCNEYDEQTLLEHECETLGFLISRHPLTLYQDHLKKLNYIQAKDLSKFVGKRVSITGWLVTRKATRTKKDEMMEFISFEDTTDIYETVFFPDTYNKFCYMMTHSKPYLLTGKVEKDFDAVTLTVGTVKFL